MCLEFSNPDIPGSAEEKLKGKLKAIKRVAERSLDRLKRSKRKSDDDEAGREFILRSLSSDEEYGM